MCTPLTSTLENVLRVYLTLNDVKFRWWSTACDAGSTSGQPGSPRLLFYVLPRIDAIHRQ